MVRPDRWLGALAGLAFSAAAVAARPLASAASFDAFIRDPLLYLLIIHSVVGQLLLGMAMQRGSTTAAVAAMDAAGAVPAAIVGLLLLNDKIWPGREWLAAIGFVITLAAVLGLTRYAEPQHHHARHDRPGDHGRPGPDLRPGDHGRPGPDLRPGDHGRPGDLVGAPLPRAARAPVRDQGGGSDHDRAATADHPLVQPLQRPGRPVPGVAAPDPVDGRVAVREPLRVVGEQPPQGGP